MIRDNRAAADTDDSDDDDDDGDDMTKADGSLNHAVIFSFLTGFFPFAACNSCSWLLRAADARTRECHTDVADFQEQLQRWRYGPVSV